MKKVKLNIHPTTIFFSLLLLFIIDGCGEKSAIDSALALPPPAPEKEAEKNSDDEHPTAGLPSKLRTWYWKDHTIPGYQWPEGTAFGNGLYIDVAYDPTGVQIIDDQIKFHINPLQPTTPDAAGSNFNYRSEFHTAPWPIRHPLGTEQWMGWRYIFGDNYQPDPTAPITIFQNHPGIRGYSPQFELELAGLNDPRPAEGGEVQIVNAANNDRIVLDIKPLAGDTLDIVVQVVYDLANKGLLKLWINSELQYHQAASTVYADAPWGGNNKWGIYHHTFNNNPEAVEKSLQAGGGNFDLWMGPLRMITRSLENEDYLQDAYDRVKPK